MPETAAVLTELPIAIPMEIGLTQLPPILAPISPTLRKSDSTSPRVGGAKGRLRKSDEINIRWALMNAGGAPLTENARPIQTSDQLSQEFAEF